MGNWGEVLYLFGQCKNVLKHICTFEKKTFLEMGGCKKFILNDDQDDHQKWEVVLMCGQKWGESCGVVGHVKNGTPPQPVFGTFPYFCLFLLLILSYT